MSRNWELYGIAFEASTVEYEKKMYPAEYIVVRDMLKFVGALKAAGCDVMDIINASNSVRVQCQDVCRKNATLGREEKRERMWQRLIGIRSSRTTTRTIVALPNGATWEGSSMLDLVQTYISIGTGLGLPIDVCRNMGIGAAKAAGLVDDMTEVSDNN